MQAKDAIKNEINIANLVITTYLKDLSDEELLIRPVPEANHIAWQLGHIIVSSDKILKFLKANKRPELSDDFIETYSKEGSYLNSSDKFHSKETYLRLMQEQVDTALLLLDSLDETDFNKPGPEDMRSYAPTVGAILLLLGNHPMMHAGQIAVLRRKLGKPIVI